MSVSRQVKRLNTNTRTQYSSKHTRNKHTKHSQAQIHKYTNTQIHSTSRARSNKLFEYKPNHIDHSHPTQQSLYNKQHRENTSHTVQYFTCTLHVHNITRTLQVHNSTRALHTQIDSNHKHSLPICRSGEGRHRSWQTRRRPVALKKHSQQDRSVRPAIPTPNENNLKRDCPAAQLMVSGNFH